jgi:hypothetical protein
LRDGCPLSKNAAEISIAPLRGEMNEIVTVEISVDQSRQSDKWQIWRTAAIGRGSTDSSSGGQLNVIVGERSTIAAP